MYKKGNMQILIEARIKTRNHKNIINKFRDIKKRIEEVSNKIKEIMKIKEFRIKAISIIIIIINQK